MTAATRRYLDKAIGPRREGGTYRSGRGYDYQVVAITRDPNEVRQLLGYDGSGWAIEVTVTGDDIAAGETRVHCTPWDHRRDRVISQP